MICILFLRRLLAWPKIFIIEFTTDDLHVDKTRVNLSQPFPRLTFFLEPTNLLYIVSPDYDYDGWLGRCVIR